MGSPSETPPPLPADQRVFLFSAGSNGWTSSFAEVMSGLNLVVYGDGRVFELAESQSTGLPPAYELARVDPLAVARFARDAEKQDLVNDTTDFGDATVTDQGSTTVALHGSSGRTSVNVYAFEKLFEDGLTRAQRRNRTELRTMIASAYALADDAQRSPYLPERVRVLEFEYPQGGQPPGAPPWPGPDLTRILHPRPTRGRHWPAPSSPVRTPNAPMPPLGTTRTGSGRWRDGLAGSPWCRRCPVLPDCRIAKADG